MRYNRPPMGKVIALFVALSLGALAVPPAEGGTGGRVRIDFDKTPLRDVAKRISDVTGHPLLLPDSAQSLRITLLAPKPMTRAQAWRAFLSILERNDLTV